MGGLLLLLLTCSKWFQSEVKTEEATEIQEVQTQRGNTELSLIWGQLQRHETSVEIRKGKGTKTYEQHGQGFPHSDSCGR